MLSDDLQVPNELDIVLPIDSSSSNFAKPFITSNQNGVGLTTEKWVDEVFAQHNADISLSKITSDFASGILTVGKSGHISVNYLVDGGQYEGEVALFSLDGMDELTGVDFIQKAATRALSDSLLGRIIISDRIESAKYNTIPGENRHWNRGKYLGPRTFDFDEDAQLALMFVPHGTIKEISLNPEAKGSTRPLFSIPSLNPKGESHFGQISYGTNNGYTLALEDQNFQGTSDRDYNDLIFQITGVTPTITNFDDVIDPVQDWRETPIGKDLIDYLSLPVAPDSDVKYKPHELLVKFSAEATDAEISHLMADYGATDVQLIVPPDDKSDSQLHQWRVITFDSSVNILELETQLANNDRIIATDLNVLLEATAVTNDPNYDSQWALPKIEAAAAWEISQNSSEEIVVAVLDTGIDYEHPDIKKNIWRNITENTGNKDEIAGNDIDDDGNGYIDDYYGYDFSDGNTKPLGLNGYVYPAADTPRDANGHGTHVAGIIGAAINNGVGISGASPNVKLMAVQFLSDGSGSGTVAEAVAAIHYALKNDADIINASFGGYLGNKAQSALQDALLEALNKDVLVVTAAGNRQLTTVGGDGNRNGNGGNNDTQPFYPASFDLPNVISVAATNQADELAAISNYGETTVHLSAPGTDILSTLPTEKRPNGQWVKSKEADYGEKSGTSMAAPFVTAVAAEILAANPNLLAGEVKEMILDTVDRLPSLKGKTITGGRVNAREAVQAAEIAPLTPRLESVRRLETSTGESLREIITDQANNVYTAGFTQSNLSGANADSGDAFITKYNAQGQRLWSHQLKSNQYDTYGDAAVDKDGNIYALGTTNSDDLGIYPGSDLFVSKYAPDGNLLWNKPIGTSGAESFASSIHINKNGELYIASATTGDFTNTDEILDYTNIFVSKYNQDLNPIWTRQFNTTQSDLFQGAEIDKDGNIYIVSAMYELPHGPGRVYRLEESIGNRIIKLNSSGKVLWKIEEINNKRQYGNVAVNSKGEVFVSGKTSLETEKLEGFPAFFTHENRPFWSKYDQNGNKIWHREIELDKNEMIFHYSPIKIDSEDNTYMAFQVVDKNLDSFSRTMHSTYSLLLKYDKDDNLLWKKDIKLSPFYSSFAFNISNSGDLFFNKVDLDFSDESILPWPSNVAVGKLLQP